MQRAESRARALGPGEAHHHEIVGPLRAHLDPVARASAPVGRVGLLPDDPLQAQPRDLAEHGLALRLEVLEVAERARLRHHAREQPLALHQRQRPHVEALERHQVEQEQRGRLLHRGAPDVGGAGEPGALRQAMEARAAGIVVHHHLAVHHEPLEGQRRQRARQLRKRRREVVAVARGELPFTALPRGEHPVAVQLRLEDPAIPVEGLLARFGQHQLDVLRAHLTARGAQPLQRRAERRRDVGARLQDLDRQPREHRARRKHGAVPGGHLRIAFLDEQPFLLGLLDLHQRPATLELVALEVEEQLPLLEPHVRILDGHPHPAVPHDHRARAVVPLRDDPLEVAVLERVVLDQHREALVGLVARGPLGHGPGAQHTVHLEPEVEVELPGRVLVDDEQVAGERGHDAGRLRGRLERTLCAISA